MTTHAVAARSARGTRRRAQILDAAVPLLVDPGYRATSLRDIAAAAGITHPGLLRHFRAKDEILLAIVERYEEANARWAREHLRAEDGLDFSRIARRNAALPGYLEVFSALAGEATSARHPAHEHMRERYRGIRSTFEEEFARAQATDAVGADRDAFGEGVRLASAWDGLQLLELYAPDLVDTATALARHRELIRRPRAAGEPRAARDEVARGIPPLRPPADEVPPGYAVGRARRERILNDARALFASEGYADTSMRTIAERVGVSKSSLFHHFASKEDLLRAMLVARDAEIARRATRSPVSSAAAMLHDLPIGAADNAAEAPGLIEVYCVLSSEAVAARHPAHDYFAERVRGSLETFTALFRAAADEGALPAHRDPAHEAAWLVALWDGLQIQWLYDRDGIDVSAQLRSHLDDVLPR
ncbi:TetR/AcrR family transcriptional regulator [Microbacterium sp. 18062]|uniref:TetR/AcrR family transcriptional regulator n=1 Tax=Microbacterium sp. 18062 TaxID=2681410 RepID=UPI001357A234|nr:TetR/AcrR family transcriptional regulator [Microbacterium sp. 18062]